MADERIVLVIDDEEDARAFVEEILSDVENIVVAKAENGVEGIQKAKELTPALVCLDIQMPEKNGFEVFCELKNDDKLKNVPVIMMTGVGQKVPVQFNAEEVGELLGSAPDVYVEKPIDPELLRKKVEELLAGSNG